MKKRCTVCGFIMTKPEKFCPQCKAPDNKFAEVVEGEGAIAWADEHVIGVAKGADKEIIQGLKEHFMGECTEVGMYLAMARAASREGFPEIAESYTRIALEEADHAAKFCELLGELVSKSTKENLAARAAAEQGACLSKKQIATKAKELGYDAIHDTVHEMAKDEARHGAAFNGMLKRYFG